MISPWEPNEILKTASQPGDRVCTAEHEKLLIYIETVFMAVITPWELNEVLKMDSQPGDRVCTAEHEVHKAQT